MESYIILTLEKDPETNIHTGTNDFKKIAQERLSI